MIIQYIQLGKSNQSAHIERFNKIYRTEFLNLYLFQIVEEVRAFTYWWKLPYNEQQLHDALTPPSEFLSINAENFCFELPA